MSNATENRLPVEAALPELLAVLARSNRAILVAPPGAGKTTLVPVALLGEGWMNGKVLVLEPRRIAARVAASHMAGQLGEAVGGRVGYRVRLESRVSAQTRIEFLTEGVFTRMIVDDPELPGVSAVIFDEFHERGLEADLGLALALDAQASIRPDLRMLVMSATLQSDRISAMLEDAPVIQSTGRTYPVAIEYSGRDSGRNLPESTARAVRSAIAQKSGSVLVFLPGQREIRQTKQLLEGHLPANTRLHQLYGALDTANQDEAIRPAAPGIRKIVLATAIAETSLTIEGVTIVIDSGLRRAPRYEPATGLTRLQTVRASRSSVEQRAGRAGRMAPGTVIRLWHEPQNAALPAHDTPEILQADLSGLVLDLAEWGIADPGRLKWLDAPPKPAWDEAVSQLQSLGALDPAGLLTPVGRQLRRIQLPPRLASMVVKSSQLGFGREAAMLAMLVTERGLGGAETDLADRLERFGRENSQRAKAARKSALSMVEGMRRTQSAQQEPLSAGALLSFAYPDRIAKSRGSRGRFLLANGRGAQLDETETLASAGYLVVAVLQGSAAASRILSAAQIGEKEILHLHSAAIVRTRQLLLDEETGRFRASTARKLGAITLAEAFDELRDEDRVGEAICGLVKQRGLQILPWKGEAGALRDRLNFLHHMRPVDWPDVGDDALADAVGDWLMPFLPKARGIGDISTANLRDGLMLMLAASGRTGGEVDRLAPSHFRTPAGSKIAIRYGEAKAVLAVRVQEMFGLVAHPAILDGEHPLTLELLSPAHRPIQLTTDLPGFWAGSWVDVRREMRGRYPKHYWPQNPAAAAPTSRAKPRGA